MQQQSLGKSFHDQISVEKISFIISMEFLMSRIEGFVYVSFRVQSTVKWI